jgi:hypothetical protein
VVLVVVAQGDLPQAEVLPHLVRVMLVLVHLAVHQIIMAVEVGGHLRLARLALTVLGLVAMEQRHL